MATNNKMEEGREQEQQILDIFESLSDSQKYAFVLGKIYALLKIGNDTANLAQTSIDDADEELKKLHKIEHKPAPKKTTAKKGGKTSGGKVK